MRSAFLLFPLASQVAFGQLQYSVGDYDFEKNICDFQLARKVVRASFLRIDRHFFMGAFIQVMDRYWDDLLLQMLFWHFFFLSYHSVWNNW